MRMTDGSLSGWRDPRAWCAVLLLGIATYFEYPFDSFFLHPLLHAFHVHRPPPNTLGEVPYGTQMLVRLLWDLLLWVGVCLCLKQPVTGFPFRSRRGVRLFAAGLATGLLVMLATMLGIWALGAASILPSGQTVAGAVGNASWWLVLDEGHVFNFLPRGPVLLTGGSVGPEGSLLAFVAVLAALALLVVSERPQVAHTRADWGR